MRSFGAIFIDCQTGQQVQSIGELEVLLAQQCGGLVSRPLFLKQLALVV